MEWLLAFALGLLCAWVLLRALKWLPVVLVVAVPARGDFYIKNTGSATVYFSAGYASGSSCNGHVGDFTTSGPTVAGGTATVTESGYAGRMVYIKVYNASVVQCEDWTCTGQTITEGMTINWAGCSGGPGDNVPTYYGNYCITNDTGHPATFKFSDSCGYVSTMNLAPGVPWCVSYSNTNLACFPVQFSWLQWDGTGQGWGPAEPPNGTNSPPSPTPIPDPTPGPGPNPNPGPGGTNGATGGDLGKLQTNLTTVLNFGFGYVGNVIGGFGMNASNQAAAQILQFSMMTNELGYIVTNTAGTNVDSPYFQYLTNLPDMKGKLGSATNYLASLTNLLTNLDNFAGSNRFGVGSTFSTGSTAVGWSYAGVSNQGHAVSMALSNAFYTNVAGTLSMVGVISNFTVPTEDASIWRIPMRTNMAGTGYTGGAGGSALDLAPSHQSFFTAAAGWVRIMAYWTIVAFYIRWAYNLFYDRASVMPLVPSEVLKGDATLGVFTLPVRLGTWGALLSGFPALVWAALGSWQSWPGAAGAPVSPFAGATLAGFGVWGPFFSESLAVVDTMFPLTFAAAVLASMPVVRLTVDSISLFMMAKLKWL